MSCEGGEEGEEGGLSGPRLEHGDTVLPQPSGASYYLLQGDRGLLEQL